MKFLIGILNFAFYLLSSGFPTVIYSMPMPAEAWPNA